MHSDTPELEVEGVSKRFGPSVAVETVTFQLRKGEFLSLLGPSGCGKTTTLRMIAGFLQPDTGTIRCRGIDITQLPPYRRDVGLVFQNYALFPHMSVEDNVSFGLRMRHVDKPRIRERVQWALETVRLGGYGSRRPHELSGGQQQRVAVARVLAAGAALLLFDEPFSNLDAKLRKEMQTEMRELQQRLGIAVMHVTHDQEEAITMSDRLIIMNAGRMEQEGTPVDIYRQPRSAFVADFIGRCNRLQGRLRAFDPTSGILSLHLDSGASIKAVWGGQGVPPERGVAYIRPEHITVGESGHLGGQANVLPGTVRRSVYVGAQTTLHVALDDSTEVCVEFSNPPDGQRAFEPGSHIELLLPAAGLRVLPG